MLLNYVLDFSSETVTDVNLKYRQVPLGISYKLLGYRPFFQGFRTTGQLSFFKDEIQTYTSHCHLFFFFK